MNSSNWGQVQSSVKAYFIYNQIEAMKSNAMFSHILKIYI